MSAADNIKAAVQAIGDAGDVNKQISFGTPGSKVKPPFPGSESTDTGKLWTPGEWVDELVNAIGSEIVTRVEESQPRGSFYGDPTGSIATALSPGTPVRMAGLTNSLLLFGVTHPTSNRLVYTGTDPRVFVVVAEVMVDTDTVFNAVRLLLYKNGAPTQWGNGVGIPVIPSVPLADSQATIGLVGLVTLTQNQYLELWLQASIASNVHARWRNMVMFAVR